MGLEVMLQSALSEELELSVGGSGPRRRGVAGLLRSALGRWGLCPKAALLRYARQQLDAVGLPGHAEFVQEVLNDLRAFGECVEVSINNEPYIAACQPRWIPTGRGNAALLSVYPLPGAVVALNEPKADDIIRRVRADADWAASTLSGVRRCELWEWMEPMGYIIHARRRRGELIQEHHFKLRELWKLLQTALEEHGIPLSEEAKLRILSGEPGGYFGKYGAERCEGRWTEEASDGVWCAYRPGYNEQHWHPVLASVYGRERKVLDLYDRDEWRWAVLARGVAVGTPEQLIEDEGRIKLSFPPPAQLKAALDLLGHRVGAWLWEVSEGAPQILPLLV